MILACGVDTVLAPRQRLGNSSSVQMGGAMGKKVQFSGYELDFGRFQLSRDGKPVALEGLPLQLLMFLVENPGQLVTRDQIADKLWGKDVFVDIEQGINTAVRKIRRALEDDSAQPKYLQTVVGRGYRFVAETRVVGDTNSRSRGAFLHFAGRVWPRRHGGRGLEPEVPISPRKIASQSAPRRRFSARIDIICN